MRRTRAAAAVGGLLFLGVVALWAMGSGSGPPASSATTSAATTDRPDPGEVFDPVRAGEPLPAGFRQVLDRDQIEPVYDPVFAAPSDVDWPEDMLVIGVAGADTAKAYPVPHLNRREMVIDSLEGIPILVSW